MVKVQRAQEPQVFPVPRGQELGGLAGALHPALSGAVLPVGSAAAGDQAVACVAGATCRHLGARPLRAAAAISRDGSAEDRPPTPLPAWVPRSVRSVLALGLGRADAVAP